MSLPVLRHPAAVLVLVAALPACGGTTFRYEQTASPGEVVPLVTVRDETFVVQLRNGTATPIYIDWSTARFVDVSGLERPLVLLSEHNVGNPDLPLDPGAMIIYQLSPAHFYIPPDRLWARRTSLRELITYPDQLAASASRQVTLRVGYCVGQPCAAPEACCAAPAARQTIEASLVVAPEVRP
jgi:hypothetical protein